jgi:hypothetical protein
MCNSLTTEESHGVVGRVTHRDATERKAHTGRRKKDASRVAVECHLLVVDERAQRIDGGDVGNTRLSRRHLAFLTGRGVSEWSLLIIPHKVAIVMAIGGLIGLNFALLADQPPTATFVRQQVRSVRCGLMTSVGALLASLTCITLYWIICHSGPTWVVSLAILGLDLSTTWALEPLGTALSLAGAATLLLSAVLTIYENHAATIETAHAITEPVPC